MRHVLNGVHRSHVDGGVDHEIALQITTSVTLGKEVGGGFLGPNEVHVNYARNLVSAAVKRKLESINTLEELTRELEGLCSLDAYPHSAKMSKHLYTGYGRKILDLW
jgi:hypothetical protein